MVGHLIHIYDSFIKNIMEGKVEGSRGRGRPGISHLSQIKEKVAVISHQKVKDAALKTIKWGTCISYTDKSRAFKLIVKF